MRGFILAAGFGKRMGIFTQNCPKPLLEIDGIKLLDYSLYLLKNWKVNEIITNTHYLSKQIEEYFANFPSLRVHISYEQSILGTGGGIFTGINRYWASSNSSDDEFVVINPDTVLFPKSNFLPQFPENQHDSLSHLYLKATPYNANYTNLFWKDGNVYFEYLKDSIPCYYIGLSLFKIHAFDLLDQKSNENFELGSLWRHLSKEGKLTGEFFQEDAIVIGEKKLFDEILVQKDFFKGKKQEIKYFLSSIERNL